MKAFTNAAGFGIYAADQIALHECFDIIGGLRWDYFSANQQNKLPGQELRHHGQDVELPCRAGFSSDATAKLLFSYASAFNPSAEGLVLAANNQATPPEKNEIFEIGSKFFLWAEPPLQGGYSKSRRPVHAP